MLKAREERSNHININQSLPNKFSRKIDNFHLSLSEPGASLVARMIEQYTEILKCLFFNSSHVSPQTIAL